MLQPKRLASSGTVISLATILNRLTYLFIKAGTHSPTCHERAIANCSGDREETWIALRVACRTDHLAVGFELARMERWECNLDGCSERSPETAAI
jgi:hypothetical protein